MMFNLNSRYVTKAYNGKEGCACGCRGNYSKPSTPATKRRVKKVEAFVGPMRPDAANFGDAASYSSEPFCGEYYVYVREGERVTCVNFK